MHQDTSGFDTLTIEEVRMITLFRAFSSSERRDVEIGFRSFLSERGRLPKAMQPDPPRQELAHTALRA